ncbi:integrase [Planomonospora corallina]|uniref:Integrase n=1 Tax=Planomonospora corallina TaxID=1806052 RepID=A0ABV8IDQ6_9ACTN
MRVTFATEPARPDRPNEDFVGATPDAVVLLDGAGEPAGLESGCSHSVAWYSRTLGSALLAELTQSSAPLTEVLAAGIKQVASLHEGTCNLLHAGSPSATVVMLRRTSEALEWLVLADSVLVLDVGTAEPMVICDDRLDRVAAPHRARLEGLPYGSPEYLQARREYITTLRAYRNRDGGFWVAAVDPLAGEHALTGSVPVDTVRAVAVLSDGASRLVDRFGRSTWRQLLDVLEQGGAAELIRRTRTAERSDPQGERWPRGKIFDDATAVYCTLSSTA